MMTRRRFLAISAAALAGPAAGAAALGAMAQGAAPPIRWQGHAMGAEISLSLDADISVARPAIRAVRDLIERCEMQFSLYRPQSALSRLNHDGHLSAPAEPFHRLLRLCDDMHRLTNGRFDPSIQPLWSALAQGGDANAARQAIGWRRVRITPAHISLGRGQALTLNGIAQGFATDLVAQTLRDAGLSRVLVNIGEFHAGGRPWTLGISDPVHGLVAVRNLRNRAIATSSPGAMHLSAGQPHILNPRGADAPLWSTISVEAAEASIADALSTAFCHAPAQEIANMLRMAPGTPEAICVAADGSIHRIRP